MKVYDTDEKAVASGARRRLLARVLQLLLMLALSALGLWVFYTLVLAPKTAHSVREAPLAMEPCRIAASAIPKTSSLSLALIGVERPEACNWVSPRTEEAQTARLVTS